MIYWKKEEEKEKEKTEMIKKFVCVYARERKRRFNYVISDSFFFFLEGVS